MAVTHLTSTELVRTPVATGLVAEPFRGSNGELHRFVTQTWLEAYEGKFPVPIWTEDYFDWQMQCPASEPDRRLAVYDSDRLAGVLLGTPHQFNAGTATIRGAYWSWLSIDRQYRGIGLARTLDEKRVALERQAGSDLIVSYRYIGTRHSLAERPSTRYPLKKFHSRLGFWARPLNGERLRRWNLNRTEAAFGRLLFPLLPAMTPASAFPVSNGGLPCDINDCLNVLQGEAQGAVLATAWNRESLTHQLAGSPLSQSVVAEHQGRVKGLVNYHILPFQGRTQEPVAIIDIIAVSQLPRHLQKSLLLAALSRMRDQGAILALKLRSADLPTPLMLQCGFVPRWPDSSLVLQWTCQVTDIPGRKPLHLLWR